MFCIHCLHGTSIPIYQASKALETCFASPGFSLNKKIFFVRCNYKLKRNLLKQFQFANIGKWTCPSMTIKEIQHTLQDHKTNIMVRMITYPS